MRPILFYFHLLITTIFLGLAEDNFFEGLSDQTSHSTPEARVNDTHNNFFASQENRSTGPHQPVEIFAYVHSHLVQLRGTDVVVNRPYANLRRRASRYSRIINLGKLGDSFPYAGSITSPDDGKQWYKVWLRDPLIMEPGGERVKAKVIAAVSLRLRKTPPTNGRNGMIVGTLFKDELLLVDLDESVGNWYRVYATGKDGFAHKNYIQIVQADASSDSNPPRPATFEANLPSESTRASTPPPPTSPRAERGSIRRADGGVEIVGVPMLYQGRNDPYDPSGGRGWRPQAYCGPTSMQMIFAYYGVRQSRDALALTRLSSNGDVLQTNYRSSQFRGQVYAKDRGSAYAPMVAMAKYLGFRNTTQQFPPLDPSPRSGKLSMREMLEDGRPQIVAVRGLLRYTDGTQWRSQGHVMVVRGMTGNGDIILHDPARNGGDKIMRRRDFLSIWRGFTVDIKR